MTKEEIGQEVIANATKALADKRLSENEIISASFRICQIVCEAGIEWAMKNGIPADLYKGILMKCVSVLIGNIMGYKDEEND